MPATWQIVRIAQEPSLAPDRAGQLETLVFYTLTTADPQNPITQMFLLRIPRPDPSPEEIRAAVERDARMKAMTLGLRGTV